MSEKYYMYDYHDETEEEYETREEISELNNKIEDLEMKVSELEDELSYAIPIEWLEQWDRDNGADWNLGYTISYIIKDWRKSNN